MAGAIQLLNFNRVVKDSIIIMSRKREGKERRRRQITRNLTTENFEYGLVTTEDFIVYTYGPRIRYYNILTVYLVPNTRYALFIIPVIPRSNKGVPAPETPGIPPINSIWAVGKRSFSTNHTGSRINSTYLLSDFMRVPDIFVH